MSTPKNEGSRPSFKEDMDAVGKALHWVAFALVLPSLLGSLAVGTIFSTMLSMIAPADENPILKGLDVWNDIGVAWPIIVHTAPLTAGVTLIGIGIMRDWFADIWAFIVTMASILLIVAFIAAEIDLDTNGPFAYNNLTIEGNPASAIPQEVNYFIHLYSIQYFLSALLVGAFLAWAWARKILPHLEHK